MYHPWLTCVLVFIMAIFSVEGTVFAETSPLYSNYPAEEWVKENAGSGDVDLTRQFEHENDRVIRATFLKSLLTEPHKGQKLRILGAIVKGKLDLTNAEVSLNTALVKCRFMDGVNLSGN